MDQQNSPEGRWSISLCRCTEGMIHFSYGNATLHIAIEDAAALGAALTKLDAASETSAVAITKALH